MRKPKPITIDFETLPIEKRPSYPPIAVGVSIKQPGRKPKYLAWGHLEKNNCTWSDAKEVLESIWSSDNEMLFQNGKFDVDVAFDSFDLPVPKWDKIHDTMFLLFLDDPHQQKLDLKSSADRLLDMPPEERDAVADWLMAKQLIPNVRISLSKNSPHYFGKYIAFAPGDLVGRYADGDTIRTEKLFNLLWPSIKDRGMLNAYDRERRLMPILLEMEQQGLAVNLKQLENDAELYSAWLTKIDGWIVKTIKADTFINLDSGAQLIDAMIDSGKANPDLMPLTATGKIQTNKDALLLGVTDKKLLGVLKYRAQLKTCLNTFMLPWLKTARASNGLIFTTWNQIKSPKGRDNVGTKSGRLSSTPNFQNIPNEFMVIFYHDEPNQAKAKFLPKSPWKDLPPLPRMRSYIVPFKGHMFIDRDYSQQEPRILAHFDGGALMAKYLENPWIDFHDSARDELANMGKYYERKPVKNTNLGLIYAMGVSKLAIKNDMTVEEASELKKAILTLYPGLKEMYKDMRARARNNEPIQTWGGREYYCEPPMIIKGRIQTFDYKMVNILVQGSAADCTKEAIIRYHAEKHKEAKIVLNVHDQVTVSIPIRILKSEMEKLRRCLESVEFDVPILSEGEVSRTNWEDLKPYDKKGKIL